MVTGYNSMLNTSWSWEWSAGRDACVCLLLFCLAASCPSSICVVPVSRGPAPAPACLRAIWRMDLCVDLLSSSIWAPKRFGEQSILMCPFRLMCRRPSVSDLLCGIWILQDTIGIEDTASTMTCFLVFRWRNGYALFCFTRQTTVTPHTPSPERD